MEFKINFIFITCIIIALMLVLGIIFAVRDSIKQIKQEKANNTEYKAYAFLDYDEVKSIYLLEIYAFRYSFFDIKEFETYSDLINYYTDELRKFLPVEESDIFQVLSKSYQKQAIIKK